MSLINQMLQELDARRAGAGGSEPYGMQVRAVPERRRMHHAWWLVLALAVMLCGSLAWPLLRPAAPGAARDAGDAPPRLPVRQDGDMHAVPAQPLPVPEAAAEASVPAAPAAAAELQALAAAPSASADRPKALPAAAAMSVKAVAAAPVTQRPPEPGEAAVPAALSKQIRELTPQQRAENEYRKSLLLLQQGKTAEASAGLEQALQSDPQHAGARQTLIGVLLENRRQDDALRIAHEGLGVDAAQPGLAMIAARLQLEKGALRAAVETLERTLPHAADRADYRAFLGALLQRDGRHQEATENYLLALQKAPQNAVWWMGLGISLQAEQRVAEARDAFGRAKAANTLSAELLAFVEARLAQLQR